MDNHICNKKKVTLSSLCFLCNSSKIQLCNNVVFILGCHRGDKQLLKCPKCALPVCGVKCTSSSVHQVQNITTNIVQYNRHCTQFNRYYTVHLTLQYTVHCTVISYDRTSKKKRDRTQRGPGES